MRGQLHRQALELEPHQLAQIDDAALAQHLLVGHDDRVQPLGRRLDPAGARPSTHSSLMNGDCR